MEFTYLTRTSPVASRKHRFELFYAITENDNHYGESDLLKKKKNMSFIFQFLFCEFAGLLSMWLDNQYLCSNKDKQ